MLCAALTIQHKWWKLNFNKTPNAILIGWMDWNNFLRFCWIPSTKVELSDAYRVGGKLNIWQVCERWSLAEGIGRKTWPFMLESKAKNVRSHGFILQSKFMRAFQLLHRRIRHSLNLSLAGLGKGAKLKEPLNVKLIGFVSGYCSFACCVMSKSMEHAYWKKWKREEKISASVISSVECGISWCQKLHTFLSACDTRRNHIIWIKCHIVPWSSTLVISHSWMGIKFVPQECQNQFTWIHVCLGTQVHLEMLSLKCELLLDHKGHGCCCSYNTVCRIDNRVYIDWN